MDGRTDQRVSASRALRARAACQRVQMGRGNPAAGRARLSSLIAGRRWPVSAHASEGVARHQVAKCTHRRGTVFEHHEGGMPEAGYRERGRQSGGMATAAPPRVLFVWADPLRLGRMVLFVWADRAFFSRRTSLRQKLRTH